jgi:hypothetical protein
MHCKLHQLLLIQEVVWKQPKLVCQPPAHLHQPIHQLLLLRSKIRGHRPTRTTTTLHLDSLLATIYVFVSSVLIVGM